MQSCHNSRALLITLYDVRQKGKTGLAVFLFKGVFIRRQLFSILAVTAQNAIKGTTDYKLKRKNF